MKKIIVAEKTVESYLTKSKIGQFAINPYVGCSHACKYCYASFMKRFTGHSESWGDFIDIKRARHKINGSQITGKNVFMGTVKILSMSTGITAGTVIISGIWTTCSMPE